MIACDIASPVDFSVSKITILPILSVLWLQLENNITNYVAGLFEMLIKIKVKELMKMKLIHA